MTEAVLFDMDGVIVDSMHYHVETWKKAFSDKGLSIDDIDIYRREGMSGVASVREIFHEKGRKDVSDDEIMDLMSEKHRYFEQIKIKVYPDVSRMLEFLSQNKIKMGLVTGSTRRSVEYILDSNIREMFSVIVTSDDTEKGKPDPHPYLRALELLSIEPDNAIVVENAPLGIESATRAGIECLAVQTTLAGVHLEKADRVFLSHVELENYLHDFFAKNVSV